MVVACASEATRSCARRCAGATKASCVPLLGGFLVHVTASRISNVVRRSAVDRQLIGVHDGMINQWNGEGFTAGSGWADQNCTEAAGIRVLPPQDCPGALLSSLFDARAHCPRRNMTEVWGLQFCSSPDLVNWTFRGNALQVSQRPRGVYFRPKVVHNERTGQYVLWVNLLPHGGDDETPLRAYPNAT